MGALRCLHEATIAAGEIDHLGHMNVRFYLEKALRATHAPQLRDQRSRPRTLDLDRAPTSVTRTASSPPRTIRISCGAEIRPFRGWRGCPSSRWKMVGASAGRRSIEIPPRIRATLEAQYHPDLR